MTLMLIPIKQATTRRVPTSSRYESQSHEDDPFARPLQKLIMHRHAARNVTT